jgi:hypothetical protein
MTVIQSLQVPISSAPGGEAAGKSALLIRDAGHGF